MSYYQAVFLDRDGTLIEDLHYPRDAEKVRLLEGAAQGLRLMFQKGYLLVVVSNQSGVGRGIISDEQYESVHERTLELFSEHHIFFHSVHYCRHHPADQCRCRKPKVGLVPPSYLGTPIRFRKSYVVGDRESDVMLALELGASPWLVRTGKGLGALERIQADSSWTHKFSICGDLLELAKQLPKVEGLMAPLVEQTIVTPEIFHPNLSKDFK